MAQWSRKDRTLFTKVVYYGPAFGGKTTNLEALHRLTDPNGTNKLLTMKTVDDRTLFFDLLPFDLGDVLGYKVAMKIYTVPGQVRYDTTRQVVLSGADAVVFVADSSAGREEQNRWSYQNLRMNMRTKGLEAEQVPVLVQFNKQDLDEAAKPEAVAEWIGVQPEAATLSSAIEGWGVLETFIGASRAMLERLVNLADERTRKEIDTSQLGRHVDRAFGPLIAASQTRKPMLTEDPSATRPRDTIVVSSDDQLENSIEAAVELGERLSNETGRAARLEREAIAFRRLCEALRTIGSSFERDTIIDAVLGTAAEVLESPSVSLIRQPPDEDGTLLRTWGQKEDTLLGFDAGQRLLRRMVATGRPCVVNDLAEECGVGYDAAALRRMRAALVVPVDKQTGLIMVAYGRDPDGVFSQQDVRFLATLGGHLTVGLEKANYLKELTSHRDRLEMMVDSRAAQLRRAAERLRDLDKIKDRFLANLSHEMKTPLTAILSSALFLRDYDPSGSELREMIHSIVDSGKSLQGLLESLFRMVGLAGEAEPIELVDTSPQILAELALKLRGSDDVVFHAESCPENLCADSAKISRALANLIDNAVKFSPPGTPVEVCLEPSDITSGGRAVDGLAICVRDRGAGVSAVDVDRIFAPFEQGRDPLTGKPAGFGIGLHEARVIARQHGGDLEYAPRDGGGSEFRLHIPLEPSESRTNDLEGSSVES
ncbi:MAG: GAF domain-containing protein [bacterium]|nr:GAF domain-containing protein [bacterium]